MRGQNSIPKYTENIHWLPNDSPKRERVRYKKHHMPLLRTKSINKANKGNRYHIYRHLRLRPQVTNERIFYSMDRNLLIFKS